jgi:glucoamylase
VLGEVRYNPDGSLDILKWSRPQHDGPALRALVAMRFWKGQSLSAGEAEPFAQLIQGDLAYTAHHAGEVCYDIWEEEAAQHYYTCLVQCAALQQGALWAKQQGRDDEAAAYSARAQDLATQLDSFWSPWKQIYRSRLLPSGMESAKDLDFSVILGVLHAALETGLHSVEDEGVSLTMEQLEALFADEYAINREVRHHGGTAFGRYKGDCYYSGGAYFFSTFGAAEYYYRRAMATPGLSQTFLSKGDAILAHVREFIPPSGDLSEQFDQTTGKPTSARDLAWSYASFLTARYARQQALEQAGARSHA